jgi:DNA-binding transcriptional MerR regulator
MVKNMGLKIGALADRTGTSAPTIRYYEEIGVLRSAYRQSGGQRVYGDEDVKRLTFVRRCREFGFSIETVRSLVVVLHDPRSSCMEARDLAQQHLVEVRQKISELKSLERSIATFVADCDVGCAGPDCVILGIFRNEVVAQTLPRAREPPNFRDDKSRR